MNKEKFIASVTGLATTFGRELPPLALDGYWHVMRHLDESELAKATDRALRECKFMPAPSELLAFVRRPNDPAVDAVLAWQAIRRAIDKYDWNVGSIDFGPLVNAVIRNIGGWDTLCKASLKELDNPGWLRKRFGEVYMALAGVETAALHGEPLDGELPANYRNPIHAVVSVDGQPARPRLEEAGAAELRATIGAHVRALAEAKSQ